MKILVTGGNGFIGQHLVKHLTNLGHYAYVFDRFGGADFKGDIKDADAVFDAINQTDRWVNLAGLLGTAEMLQVPQIAVDVNIKGALNVFEAARLYGKTGLQIAVGNYWMNNPYSLTKNTAERFAHMYNKEHRTDIRIVRAMNVFGEGQKHTPVRKIFPNVVIPALLGKPITIYGSGNQVMDLIHVSDVCEILGRVLLTDTFSDVVFEVGRGGGYTINNLVHDVIEITGSSSQINHVDMRPGEDKEAVVEISEQGWDDLASHLGYFKGNLGDLREQMNKCIMWYEDHMEEIEWQG